MEILKISVSFLLAIAGYVAWKRYHDKDYLLLIAVAVISLLLRFLNYVIAYYIQLPSEVVIIGKGASVVVLVMLILVVLKIVISNLKDVE